jgi:uncharacterized HAD superfamily protein
MEKPVIAVDIDDVLWPHFEALSQWYNHRYGTQLALSDNHPLSPVHWATPELQAATLRRWGASSVEEAVGRVRKFFATPEFTNAQAFALSYEVLNQLSSNYELVAITAREYELATLTRDWLNDNYPRVFTDVYFTARFNLEGKSKDKVEMFQELAVNYCVDDDPVVAMRAAKAGIATILFGEYPWNQDDSLDAGITRCVNWNEVKEYFDKVEV